MKTTVRIDDRLMARAKREAARRGCTMSELVETALRLLLQQKQRSRKLRPLPTFRSGGHLVDIADRDALSGAMGASPSRKFDGKTWTRALRALRKKYATGRQGISREQIFDELRQDRF